MCVHQQYTFVVCLVCWMLQCYQNFSTLVVGCTGHNTNSVYGYSCHNFTTVSTVLMPAFCGTESVSVTPTIWTTLAHAAKQCTTKSSRMVNLLYEKGKQSSKFAVGDFKFGTPFFHQCILHFSVLIRCLLRLYTKSAELQSYILLRFC